MAALTRHVGGYLGDVVIGWQRVRNSSADLRRAVRFDLSDNAATRVVTSTQVDTVHTFLDTVAPSGRVGVSMDGDDLVVGTHRLRLDELVDVPSLFFDPMPIALLMNAAWIAATTGSAPITSAGATSPHPSPSRSVRRRAARDIASPGRRPC